MEAEEHVLGPHALARSDAASIYATLKDVIQRFGISLQLLALTFQGEKSGVAARLQRDEPRAVATHCHMHCVDLAVQDSVYCGAYEELSAFSYGFGQLLARLLRYR